MESVWDYPRPPRVEAAAKRVTVELAGRTIADSTRTYRVLETSHPPVYYVPAGDVADGVLIPNDGRQTFCEWKGHATYYDVVGGDGQVATRAAWTYLDPTPAFSEIRGAVAFYPRLMDQCAVGGEVVTPQEGDFYGGWITADIDIERRG